jgi:small conductance mechanosensitive channel
MDLTAYFNEEIATVIPLGTIIFRLSLSLVIVLIGFILGRFAGKIARRMFSALEIGDSLERAGIHGDPEIILEQIVRYVIYIATIILALNQLGITPVVLNIIFAGIIAVIIIAVFLSMKDFIPNLISGMYILAIKKIAVKDTITVNGVKGTVSEISLVETTLKNNGHKIIIPNSTITKSQIKIHGKKKE